jgi:hypothetical protein
MSPTPAAQERNRRTQKALRDRRRANMTRVHVWLPRTTAADLAALAEAQDTTYADLLSRWIRQERDGMPGQSVID